MKRILVVDDDDTILELLKEALPALGFQADFANTGNRAIELIDSQTYDLILSDVRMPEKNGIDVARAAYQRDPHLPILFMSGNPNTIVEERSFLAKPFTIPQLETKIEFAISPPDEEGM